MSRTSLLWLRQDLRLADHLALREAASSDRLAVVYLLDDEGPGEWALGGAARWWLHGSLDELGRGIAERGGTLTLRRGRAETAIPALAREVGADAVHVSVQAEPWWRAADDAIAHTLESEGRRLVRHRDATLIDPDRVKTKTGGIYGMYTPFSRAVRALGDPPEPAPAPRRLPPSPPLVSDTLSEWDLLPTRPDWAGGLRATWRPGEGQARARLTAFLRDAASRYETGRNLPGEAGTSMLSPHLHWGEISPRTVWHAARALGDDRGAQVFLNEIIWRDFSSYLLWHNPTMPERPLRADFARLPFRHDKDALAAWQRGRTGVPIVDAGLRQLWQIGWMHNRVRMIAASFLVKHLLTSWIEGERWFWDTLVDADLASNGASWQWVAGTGIDSQPFFRVFNPVTQGEKFDPEGGYVRRWVPELARMPDKYLHAPWTAPAQVLEEAGVALGKTYPRPIVDLDEGRRRALDVYRRTVRRAA